MNHICVLRTKCHTHKMHHNNTNSHVCYFETNINPAYALSSNYYVVDSADKTYYFFCGLMLLCIHDQYKHYTILVITWLIIRPTLIIRQVITGGRTVSK